ncbi:srs domain-containing protein [Neospora caninum Liverpool]|uniref:Srs domain-containing protein n=1 Tax=Neospora caninum (strain Liverpool) TaxID=572307 RepID=F0VAB3_NEOCL|nr:srs domain-containing protein [Neospora caninum Liverpool]CBZ50602.1 srs domain-containing protein [Neospora caninum Liverpool]CEL65214.1 TPA: SRS domain-containing protein [Neospora caninum Liverpool]|eukprot:XP_003880635.1 srs domain-containing protein [Neospora caninum Liverpool]
MTLQFLAGVAVLGCLVATGEASYEVAPGYVRRERAGLIEIPSDDDEERSIDLDRDDLAIHLHVPPLELADLLHLEPQECKYPEDGEGVGRLELSVTNNPGVTFRCPGGHEDELEPPEPTLAYRVNSDGSCDTTASSDMDIALPNAILEEAVSHYGRGSFFLLINGRPLDSEKKACFVCKGKTGSNKGKSCTVIVTVPKASLPNSWVCDPLLPPGGNMVTFQGDGSEKTATVLCPPGYSNLDSPDEDGYVMTGPQCMTKAKLEDVLGSGSTIKTVELKSPPRGVSKSYQVTATSSFAKPRILCLACEPGKNEQVSSSAPNRCMVEAFLPAAAAEVSDGDSDLQKARGLNSQEPPSETGTSTVTTSTVTPSTVTPSTGATSDEVVLSCATSAALLAVMSGLTAVAM